MAPHSAIFVFHIILKVDFPKLNLLPKASIQSFWDTLWLGIWPFLCFIAGSCTVVYSTTPLEKIEFGSEACHRELLEYPVARHLAVFVFYCRIL